MMSMLRIIEERFMITTHKRFIYTYTEIRVDTQTRIWYIHISICTRAISIVLWRRFSWNVSSDTILSTRSLYIEELRHRDGAREREPIFACMRYIAQTLNCSAEQTFHILTVNPHTFAPNANCIFVEREKNRDLYFHIQNVSVFD